MRLSGGAAAALALLLTACGTDTSSAPRAVNGVSSPPASTATASTSTTPSATAAPTDEGTPARGPAQARQKLDRAVREMAAEPALGFSVRLRTAEGAPVAFIDGRYVVDGGWQAHIEIPNPGGLGTLESPSVLQFDVVASGGRVFARDVRWAEPMTGCWLLFDHGLAPLGFGALAIPEGPGFLNVLNTARATGFDDSVHGVAAEVDLGVATGLLQGPFVQRLAATAADLDAPKVDVGLAIDQGLVTDLFTDGQDYVNAVEEEGGSVSSSDAQKLRGLSLQVEYEKTDDVSVIRAPADNLVVPDTAGMERGCQR